MYKTKILILAENQSKRVILNTFFDEKNRHEIMAFIDFDKIELEVLKSEIFDLIIVDINKQNNDLDNVIEQIRSVANIPIIVHELTDLLLLEKLIQETLTPAINLDHIKEIAELGLPEPELLIGRLVDTFKTLAPEKIKEIEQLLTMQDLATVTKVAHALRSTCYNVGAFNLAEILKELESSSRNGCVKNDAGCWAKKLQYEFQKAQSALQEILNNKLYMT